MDGMIPEGLLSPQQMEQLQQQRTSDFLLALGSGLAQTSQGMGRRPSTLAGITAALPGAVQAQRSSFDQTLQQMLRAQQMQDMQRQRAQQMQQQQQLQTFVSGLPESEQARFRAFPTQAAEAMFREPKGTFRPLSSAEVTELTGYTPKPGEAFQMSPEGEIKALARAEQGPLVKNIVGGAVSPFEKRVQEGDASMFLKIKESGIAAQRSAQDVNRLETLLSKVDTGGAAAFKQAAGNFGIKTEGLDDIQAAQAIINKLVPAQRPPNSGPMSDADLDLFKQSMPRIINQPGGNKLIIEGMKQINQYLIEEGKIAAEVTAGRITPEEGTARMFALGNPVQDFFDRTQPQPAASQQLPRQDLDLINRYLNRGR